MFTGIIEQLGVVKALREQKNLIVLSVDVGGLAKGVRLGSSIAVNGVCLTVTSQKGRVVTFDLMKETIEKTSLRQLRVGSRVNLEPALRADSRFGGHFVSGHVDELAEVRKISRAKNYVGITVAVSKASRKYIVPKGSVAIDGISLTVGRVLKDSFEVYLIPFTLKATTLGERKAGDVVNIETDILAKYILQSSRHSRASGNL